VTLLSTSTLDASSGHSRHLLNVVFRHNAYRSRLYPVTCWACFSVKILGSLRQLSSAQCSLYLNIKNINLYINNTVHNIHGVTKTLYFILNLYVPCIFRSIYSVYCTNQNHCVKYIHICVQILNIFCIHLIQCIYFVQ
jgi:hypothetical protein